MWKGGKENVGHFLSPKKRKTPKYEEKSESLPLSEIPSRLLEIIKSENKFEAFVDSITLLHNYPMCSDLILRLLVDQFAYLPENNIIEGAPLLLDALSRYKDIVSFNDLYKTLLENGRENEVWRFLTAYELSVSMLRLHKQCRLSDEDILKIIKSSSLVSNEISDLILCHPGIAHEIYSITGSFADPFILLVMDQLSEEQKGMIFKMAAGTGSNLEFILAEKLGFRYNLASEPCLFYLLNRAITSEKWDQAADLACKLGLIDEYEKYLGLSKGVSGAQLILLKKELNSQDEKRILEDFANNLETSDSNKTVADFINQASSIAEKIENECHNKKHRRHEEMSLMDRFTSGSKSLSNSKKVTIGDSCSICQRQLGHNEVYIFPCNHYFHSDCLIDQFYQLVGISEHVFRMPGDKPHECPICGLNSAAYAHVPLSANQVSSEFWSLKI